MAALKEKILSKVEKKSSVWWRYIDDIHFILEHGREWLKRIYQWDEFISSNYQIYVRLVKKKVNFLDVKVTVKNGVLSTGLFVKPTDTHQILNPTFCHPYHCKKDIPYSQILRLNRICSDNSNFDKRCNKFES